MIQWDMCRNGGVHMKKGVRFRQIGIAGILSMTLLLSGCQNIGGLGIDQNGASEDNEAEVADLLEDGKETLKELRAESSILQLYLEEEGKIELQDLDSETMNYRLLYTSSDDDICTVKQDGTVQATGVGKATVTVKDSISGLTAKVVIRVEEKVLPESITLSQTEAGLAVSKSITLRASVAPSNAQDKQVVWSSSDESIATVDKSGVVKGIAPGQCVITATLKADETIQAEVQITVSEASTDTQEDANGNSGAPAGNGGSNQANNNNGTGGNANQGSGNSGAGGNANQGSGNAGNNNTTEATTESAPAAYYMDSYAEQVLAIVNARRAEAGIGPLTMDYTLVSAAKVRAAELPKSFSHTRPDGRSCFTAFDEAGVSGGARAENIAAGYGSPDSVMNGWMNSEGHRTNIMNATYTRIGIACYYDPSSAYGYNWVQCFSN